MSKGFSRFIPAFSIVVILIITMSSFTPQSGKAMSWYVSDQALAPQPPGPLYLPLVMNYGGASSWTMAGANPERTSNISEQVDGGLLPLWYKKFEPYIPLRAQIITAHNTLYIVTSAGLYALDANSGAQKWVYPTLMPLGDSPTIDQGVVYVAGTDRMLHAIDALTGQGMWRFTAGSAFTVNPLVVNGIVYAGNRDGYFYAVYATGQQKGQLAWKYKTNGPIDYSAAYKDGVVYFASNDSYAYALNAQTGSLVWKSDKLPGAGFHSWWPVIYREWVIFAGSNNYRSYLDPGFTPSHSIFNEELWDIYPHHTSDLRGTPVGPVSQQPGDWAAKTCAINTSKPTVTANGSTTPITEYFESKPWRRTFFVLSRVNGKEYTTDFDGDGKPEYAPILWTGTHSGNSYPPVIGSDGVLYQTNNYMSDPTIAGGMVSGWKIGTPYISIVSHEWKAVDEPLAFAAGGNRIYWNHTGDSSSGSLDVSIPEPIFPPDLGGGAGPGYCSNANPYTQREVKYFEYSLNDLIPNYWTRYTHWDYSGVFGGTAGVYTAHGQQNPPIPYHGRLYMIRSNAVIAFAANAGQPVELPMAATVTAPPSTIPAPTLDDVKARLNQEVEKLVNAGHLRPGYFNSGGLTYIASWDCGYNNQYSIGDYWHNPADTHYTLLRALPYLSIDLQARVKTYLQAEFAAYHPYQVTHIGWRDGAAREVFILPPEVEAGRASYSPLNSDSGFPGWSYDPFGFYAMWKYAQVFGGAKTIFDASKSRINAIPPSDDYLMKNVQVFNSYIAGYWGYLELEKLANYPESANIRSQLNRLLSLRAATFTKDLPDTNPSGYLNYCRGLNISRNFFYLVPELGQYLHDHALSQVQAALVEYNRVAPFWFIAGSDAVYAEGATSPLYNYHSLFQAKSLILQQPFEDLSKYIDVPAVAIGDLFYIDNLISAIDAGN